MAADVRIGQEEIETSGWLRPAVFCSKQVSPAGLKSARLAEGEKLTSNFLQRIGRMLSPQDNIGSNFLKIAVLDQRFKSARGVNWLSEQAIGLERNTALSSSRSGP